MKAELLHRIEINLENFRLKVQPTIKTQYVNDGIIDVEKYLEAPVKILWVLKEAHSTDDSISDMREAIATLREGNTIAPGWGKTFKPIVYSIYGAFNDMNWLDIPDINGNPEVLDCIKSTAYINVKKYAGGAQAIDKEVSNFYNEYSDLLNEQIDIINPDVIIFGGTMKYFNAESFLRYGNKTFNDESESHLQKYLYGNKLLLSTLHPNNRSVTQQKYCDSIIQVINEWKVEIK